MTFIGLNREESLWLESIFGEFQIAINEGLLFLGQGEDTIEILSQTITDSRELEILNTYRGNLDLDRLYIQEIEKGFRIDLPFIGYDSRGEIMKGTFPLGQEIRFLSPKMVIKPLSIQIKLYGNSIMMRREHYESRGQISFTVHIENITHVFTLHLVSTELPISHTKKLYAYENEGKNILEEVSGSGLLERFRFGMKKNFPHLNISIRGRFVIIDIINEKNRIYETQFVEIDSDLKKFQIIDSHKWR